MNNGKQIGLALHDFHNDRGFLPPGGIDSNAGRQLMGLPNTAGNHGWAVWILPYVEEASVFNLYHQDQDWRASTEAIKNQIKVFNCPSAANGKRTVKKSPDADGYTYEAAASDYGVNNAISKALKDLSPPMIDDLGSSTVAYRGVMVVNECRKLTDIHDGASNTIVICEDAGRPDKYVQGGSGTASTISGAAWADRDNEYITHGAKKNAAGKWTDDNTEWPNDGIPACAVNCYNGNEVYSFHPNGATCVFADGSVRLIRADIDIRDFGRMLTRSGGEILDPTD